MTIKRDNPRYSARRIANIISGGELRFRIGYQCPWQNAVVERFHRTLNEELLRYIQPLNDRHLNRLIGKFRQ